MIRAKFRCMRVSHEWNGHRLVELRPIARGRGKDPENERFWDATPSGECHLHYPKWEEDTLFKPGDYYYLNMIPTEDGTWSLHTWTVNDGGHGNVTLSLSGNAKNDSPYYGTVMMGLSGRETLALFGEPGSTWRVEFVWAEKSED